MDAAVWRFALPEGLDEQTRQRLLREAVEAYYENLWIQESRLGLGQGEDATVRGRTPLEAARPAVAGDAVSLVKLEGILRLREQLAARPRVAILYQGYPFDRLRRRLGLEPRNPATIESNDLGCMPLDELRRLDLASLVEAELIEACRSAEALDSALAGRFASALVERDPSALVRVRPPWLVRVLVRDARQRDDLQMAREWIDRGIQVAETQNDPQLRERLFPLRAELEPPGDSPS